jgi:hypothetical protein
MRKLLIGIAVGAILATATVAAASIPSSEGIVTACAKQDGTIRLIDAEAGATCKANEQTVTWGQPLVNLHGSSTIPLTGEQQTFEFRTDQPADELCTSVTAYTMDATQRRYADPTFSYSAVPIEEPAGPIATGNSIVGFSLYFVGSPGSSVAFSMVCWGRVHGA